MQDYVDHRAHALQVCGEDHVGIGSDAGIQPVDISPESLEEFHKWEARRHSAGVVGPEEDRPSYVVGLNTANRFEVIAEE